MGLLSTMPALALAFLDQSIVPVALPVIEKTFHASRMELIWFLNSYFLVSASFVLLGGKISDWIGPKRSFLIGMGLFALASGVCASSSSSLYFIVGRALQGLGSSLMLPASFALVSLLFPCHERGMATGVNTSLGAFFLVIGPLLGGMLVEHFSWRFIFLINLPLCIMSFVMTLIFVANSPRKKATLDFRGFLYFTLTIFSLVVYLMQAGEWGFTSSTSLAFVSSIVIFALLLVRREFTARFPFLEIGLLKRPVFRAVNISVFIAQTAMIVIIFRVLFFQTALGWSPSKTGWMTFCTTIALLIVPLPAGAIADRLGPRVPIFLGFCLLAFSLLWTGLFLTSSLPLLLIGLLPCGIAIPLIQTPSLSSAMNDVPEERIGLVGGTMSTFRALSATLSVALIAALLCNAEFFDMNAKFGRKVPPQAIWELVGTSEPYELIYDRYPQGQREHLWNELVRSKVAAQRGIHFILALMVLMAMPFAIWPHERKLGRVIK